jgi:hypothetical protein
MDDIQKMISGRDSISGHVVEYALIAEAESGNNEGMYYAKLSLDTGAIVFIKSTQDYLEGLIARKDRAATFIGSFVDEDAQQLGAEDILFWDDAYLVKTSKESRVGKCRLQ